MFDLLRLLSPSYLFDVNPGSKFTLNLYLLIFFGLILLIGIIILVFIRVRKVNPPLKKILRTVPMRLEAFAIVGIFLVFFRLSAAYYLSMRFWLLVWFIVFIWYLVLLSNKIRRYPAELKEHLEREESKRYMPAKKKHK